MLDPSMTISFLTVYCPPILVGNIPKNRTQYRRRSSSRRLAVQLSSSVIVQIDENGNQSQPKKGLSGSETAPVRRHLLNRENTVGIIGGLSVFSTMIFLEKLVWWSTRDGGECLPFIVCNDPALSRYLPLHSSYPSSSLGSKDAPTCQFNNNYGLIVDNLQCKRVFLEQSGVSYIVMPCHLSHTWFVQISEGCSLPFLHVGECVARELKEAKLKPIEAGSNVRIGLLGTNASLGAGFYQKLQNQGFEVVLPDRVTMEHIMVPAIEALKRKDTEGARNLLRVGLQLLIARAVNIIILASDEMQGLLPHDDPLLKNVLTQWMPWCGQLLNGQSKENTHRKT